MKRDTRETKLKTLLRKLGISSQTGALLMDIWREVDGAHAERDARQRAEIRDLRARLKHLQAATDWLDLDRRRAAFNLANKKWRTK